MWRAMSLATAKSRRDTESKDECRAKGKSVRAPAGAWRDQDSRNDLGNLRQHGNSRLSSNKSTSEQNLTLSVDSPRSYTSTGGIPSSPESLRLRHHSFTMHLAATSASTRYSRFQSVTQLSEQTMGNVVEYLNVRTTSAEPAHLR